jgi:glutathione S-transferase
MTDHDAERLVLFHTPGTCSRVTMNALEEIGLAFEDRPIDIFKGAQRRPDYLAINPKGKVPALLVGDVLLTETPAIVAWLVARHPEAALMPGGDALERARAFDRRTTVIAQPHNGIWWLDLHLGDDAETVFFDL